MTENRTPAQLHALLVGSASAPSTCSFGLAAAGIAAGAVSSTTQPAVQSSRV